MGITINEVCSLALSLPETEEEAHWGKPSFRVRGKIFAIVQEDGVSVVVKTTKDERLANTTIAPDIYSLPESFQNLNYMRVRIDRIPADEFRAVLVANRKRCKVGCTAAVLLIWTAIGGMCCIWI